MNKLEFTWTDCLEINREYDKVEVTDAISVMPTDKKFQHRDDVWDVLVEYIAHYDFSNVEVDYEDGSWEYSYRLGKMPSGWVFDVEEGYKECSVKYLFILDSGEESVSVEEFAKYLNVAPAELEREVERLKADFLKSLKYSRAAKLLEQEFEYYLEETQEAYESIKDKRRYSYNLLEALDDLDRVSETTGYNTYVKTELSEVFTYKEEEVLSSDEVKKITSKLAELKPIYDRALAELRAKQAEFKTAGISFTKYSKDPDYIKLSDTYYNLSKQLRPLQKKLDRHNEIIKYQTATENQLATEEDWGRIIDYEWEVEVEGLEVKVYQEEDEYPSGWDSMHDSIIWTTTPSQSGIIDHWKVWVEVTKEQVADFLEKKVDEVTTRDLMNIDKWAFTEYLSTLDEVISQAIDGAEEAAAKGDWDYDDIKWFED